jgi:hypothetical protein
MTKAQMLPTLLIIISLGAAVVYGIEGDARKTIYWIAAAFLTASVTY